MEYLTEIKVRGYHTDFYGHVNNARYLEFFEEDRWARLESRINLVKWAERGLGFLVVNINVNYRKAAVVGDRLLVSSKVAKVNTKSAVLQQEIVFKESGEVSADALITFVIIDKSGRAVVLEGDLLEELHVLGERQPAGMTAE